MKRGSRHLPQPESSLAPILHRGRSQSATVALSRRPAAKRLNSASGQLPCQYRYWMPTSYALATSTKIVRTTPVFAPAPTWEWSRGYRSWTAHIRDSVEYPNAAFENSLSKRLSSGVSRVRRTCRLSSKYQMRINTGSRTDHELVAFAEAKTRCAVSTRATGLVRDFVGRAQARHHGNRSSSTSARRFHRLAGCR